MLRRALVITWSNHSALCSQDQMGAEREDASLKVVYIRKGQETQRWGARDPS